MPDRKDVNDLTLWISRIGCQFVTNDVMVTGNQHFAESTFTLRISTRQDYQTLCGSNDACRNSDGGKRVSFEKIGPDSLDVRSGAIRPDDRHFSFADSHGRGSGRFGSSPHDFNQSVIALWSMKRPEAISSRPWRIASNSASERAAGSSLRCCVLPICQLWQRTPMASMTDNIQRIKAL